MRRNRETITNKNIYRSNWIYNIILLSFLLFFLTINFITPLMGEDYALLAFSPKDHLIGINDLIYKISTRIQYQMKNWNVRVGEQLSIIFGAFDKTLFNICNSIMALYYMYLVQLYAFKGEKRNINSRICSLVLTGSMIILLQPALGEIFFWRTGSTNYMWGLCLLLTFAFPLRCYVWGRGGEDLIGQSFIKIWLLTILGFFAGFTNENTVITFWVLYVGVIAWNKLHRKKIPIWIVSSFISFSSGFFYMLNARSTAIRIAYYNQIYEANEFHIENYFSRIPYIASRFFTDNKSYIIVAFTIICLSYTLMFYKYRKKIYDKKSIISRCEILELLFLTSISCGALIMSPYIETRAFLLPEFMLVACVVYYTDFILRDFENRIFFNTIIPILLYTATILCMNNIYNTYKEYNDFCVKREMAIELSGSDIFYWGKYWGNPSNRILNTRENYLAGNEYYLETFFAKEIDVVNNYVWDIGVDKYTDGHATVGIDELNYDESTYTFAVNGWCTFMNDSSENDVYICVDTGENSFFFDTLKCSRSDVKLADQNEEVTGYQSSFTLADILTQKEKINLYLCVVDRGEKLIDKIHLGTFAV